MSETVLEHFSQDLHQEVLAKAGMGTEESETKIHHLREEIFTEAVLELLDEHNEVDGWELCSYEAKSIGSVPAAKLNAWSLSNDGATLDLFVTLYHGTGTSAEVGKPESRRQFELVLGFLKRALTGFHAKMEEASDAFQAARSIYESRDTLATVRLFLLSDGVMRSLDITPEKLPGLELRYVAWDLEKLSQLKVGERTAIELDFKKDYGGEIPCLEAPVESDEFRTFLAFFPAPLLSQIYSEYGQRLLERNVRAFLQVKGKINKGLQATLRDESNRFLAYNNGLCCTAAEVEIDGAKGKSAYLRSVKDFQIVNGGQTTASIFHAIKKEHLDLSDVIVQVKLTVIRDPERVTEIVPMISKFANSQNKVNGADFAANGKFHRELEAISRNTWVIASSGMERGTHWYYERARGSYMDDKARQGTPARRKDWAQKNPPTQKFTKTDLAKFEHAWLGLPHLVCRGAEKNFEQFASRLEEDGEPEVNQSFFEEVIARGILWRTAEKLFDSLKLTGYRAQSVAYAVAWVAEQSARRVDLPAIWKQQRLPDDLTAVLLTVCGEAHKFLSARLGNVGEAAKKPDTWAEFRDLDFGLGQNWVAGLKGESKTRYPSQKPNPEAEQIIGELANIKPESWFTLAKWAKERGFLAGWERGLAFSLGKMAAKGYKPSAKQAIQGARIFKRAKDLGFSDTA
jgi:hypothetical protein